MTPGFEPQHEPARSEEIPAAEPFNLSELPRFGLQPVVEKLRLFQESAANLAGLPAIQVDNKLMLLSVLANQMRRELGTDAQPELAAAVAVVLEHFLKSSKVLTLSEPSQGEVATIGECYVSLSYDYLNPLVSCPQLAMEMGDEPGALRRFVQLRQQRLRFLLLPPEERTEAMRELKSLTRALRFDIGRPELRPYTAEFYARELEAFVEATKGIPLSKMEAAERQAVGKRAELTRKSLSDDH